MSNKLFVSVIVAARQISDRFVFETLESLSKQTYRQFEVILVLGQSDEIATLFKSIYPWLRVLLSKGRPADKRNKGVHNARGEIIAFLDDDCFVPKDWIKQAVRFYTKRYSIALCGPGVLPQNATPKENFFDQILTSRVGSGKFTYRFEKSTPRYVDDFPSMNFIIRKDAFLGAGGFNTTYWPGEDSKLCEQLVLRDRQSIYYHPSLFVYHHRRPNTKEFLLQHARYGLHRGAFFAHGDKNSRKIIYFMPSFLILYIIWVLLSTLFTGISIYTILPLAVYGFILFTTSILISSKHNILTTIPMILVFASIHVIYGIYFMKGFFFPHQKLVL